MSSNEIPIAVVNDGDLDESDEDTDEEDEQEENLNNTDSIPDPPSQPARNLNDVLNGEEEDVAIDLDNGNDDDDGFNSDPSLVTIALPPPTKFPNSDHTQLNPHLYQDEKKIPIQQMQLQQPLDDSRKLFQRLWTDEDEIELLQGFLEYMTQRGISYHNHHDLGLFYEQIKSKLQIDFSKNQLVEKLRRLKRKYRTALNRTRAGKEISFKSPHDQATYEISRKIWSDLSSSSSNKDCGGGGVGVSIDDEDTNTTPVPMPAPNLSPNPSYNFFNQNAHYPHLNGVFDDRKLSSQNSHKRSRVSEERILMPNLNQGHGQSSNVSLGPGIHELVEETVKSCLALNNKGNELRGSRGFGGLSSGVGMLSQLGGLNFGSPSNLMGGEASERKWRKQQILELEVYSKRLELVQEQIKVTLETLRSGNNQH